MRKIIFLLCCCLSSPAIADPPARTAAEQLGYTEEMLKKLPTRHQPRAPNPDLQAAGQVRTGLPTLDKDLLAPLLYQKAEPSAMIPYLLALHKKNPRSEKVTRKLALTCLKAGQPREALHWFVQTWFRDRTDFPALWNCAAISYRLGDYRAASAYLNEYAQRDPASAWGRIAREFRDSQRFGNSEMSSVFAGKEPRGGVVTSGGESSGPSLMVVGGRDVPLPGSPSFADSVEPAGARSEKSAPGKDSPSKPSPEKPLPQKAPISRATIEAPALPPGSTEAPPPAPAPAPPPAAVASPPANP